MLPENRVGMGTVRLALDRLSILPPLPLPEGDNPYRMSYQHVQPLENGRAYIHYFLLFFIMQCGI